MNVPLGIVHALFSFALYVHHVKDLLHLYPPFKRLRRLCGE